MKTFLLFILAIFSLNLIAGVGGSTGGDVRVSNPNHLEYYLGYSSFIYNVPSVEFKVEDADDVYLPIHKTCIRNNDQIESVGEVEVTKLNSDKTIAAKVKEMVRRDRKYFKNISIFNHNQKEVEIPRDYQIKIFQSGSRANQFLKVIDYSIKDCE